MFNIERDKGSSFVKNIKYNIRKLEEKNGSINEKLEGAIEKLKKVNK